MDKNIAKKIYDDIILNFNYSMTHKYYTINKEYIRVPKKTYNLFEQIYVNHVSNKNQLEYNKYTFMKKDLPSLKNVDFDENKLARMIYNKSVGLSDIFYTYYVLDKNRFIKFLHTINKNFSKEHINRTEIAIKLLEISKYLDIKKFEINNYEKMILANLAHFYANSII